MILLILICTLIGWLCGYPLYGLLAGLVLFVLSLWATYEPDYRSRIRRKARRNARKYR